MNSILIDIFDFEKYSKNTDKKCNIKNKKIFCLKYLNIVKTGVTIKYLGINNKYIDKYMFYQYSNQTKYKKKQKKTINIKENRLFDLIKSTYFKFSKKMLEIKITKCIKRLCAAKNNPYVAILSKRVCDNPNYNDYFINLLSDLNIEIIKPDNTIVKNDINNINKYIEINNIHADKIRILWMMENSDNFDIDRLFRYIDKYKFVDILKIGSKDKKLNTTINEINKEYGTSIDILDKKNLTNYNVYVNFDLSEKLLNKYILNKRGKYIYLKDSEEDEFNENYIAFKKNIDVFREINIFGLEYFRKLDIGCFLQLCK